MHKFFFENLRSSDDKFALSSPNGNNTFPPHIHRQMEILYVTAGHNRATINNQTMILSENQMAIADSFDVHEWEHIDGLACCFILPYSVCACVAPHSEGYSLSQHFITDESVCLRFKELMDLMYRYKEESAVLEGLARAFVALIYKHLPMEKRKSNKPRSLLQEILTYIEKNFTSRLTLESVAKHFGYSKYYFSKLFNQLLGCHFEHYVNLVRMQNALYLIREKEKSLLEAALDSGFPSLSTFYRTFKLCYNCGVKTYLKQQRNASDSLMPILAQSTRYEQAKSAETE